MFTEPPESSEYARLATVTLSEGHCPDCRQPVTPQPITVTASSDAVAGKDVVLLSCDTEWWPRAMLDPEAEGWTRHQATASVVAEAARRREGERW